MFIAVVGVGEEEAAVRAVDADIVEGVEDPAVKVVEDDTRHCVGVPRVNLPQKSDVRR